MYTAKISNGKIRKKLGKKTTKRRVKVHYNIQEMKKKKAQTLRAKTRSHRGSRDRDKGEKDTV